MYYEFIFSKLGFDFRKDLELRTLIFDKNDTLTNNLKNSVFYYQSPNNTNTSFYLITTPLNVSEIEEVRRYIWNKDDADLIFYYPNEEAKLEMLYAKYSPKTTYKESILDSFSTTQKDLDKIDEIKHWQFDSGIFWFNYRKSIDKVKYKGIDKELVSTLEALKKQLDKALLKLISDKNERNETVQALIDRTLYIKYLEDNHIINSYFYNHYFKDSTLNYEKLLLNEKLNLNTLFEVIHEIFNNLLFERPTIDYKYLTKDVRELIANSFNTNLNTGQLRLFHFQFDILPVELISYIYEVFLSKEQKANGIYYTPKKLAQLIVDDVINEDKIGSILDPSSGSGMFLIVGFQRLLEIARKQNLEPENNLERIRFRTKLLSENIFGIEKQLTAQRFTLFSLSLQIFKGINPEDIKDFIANELRQNKKINLFSEFSFFENIKQANTLDISDKPFEGKIFSYIVGNPPFIRKEISIDAKVFTNSYQLNYLEKNFVAKNIIEGYQISQCFLLKVKEWSDEKTRFGFISNSSNFYDESSRKFQNFFYQNYKIDNIYELSKVKDILFENASESVLGLIFNNNIDKSIIKYYPVDLGLFSNKPFELLIIQEDKVVQIQQNSLTTGSVKLRSFLMGNNYDRELFNSLSKFRLLENLILKENENYFIHRGIEIVGKGEIEKEYGISDTQWRALKKEEKKRYFYDFKQKYSKHIEDKEFNIPFIKPQNLEPYIVNSYDCFLRNDLTKFRRCGTNELYEGNKILWNRLGHRLKAVFSKEKLFYEYSIYVIKLKNKDLYFFTTALLNSNFANYFINQNIRKRVYDSFPRIGINDIRQIPIPKELNNDLVNQISKISKALTEGKYEYSAKEDELNELIYELYELSYWEKQRIEDYFLPNKGKRFGVKKMALNKYKEVLDEVLAFYFENPIIIEEAQTDFGLKAIKLSLNKKSETPTAQKTVKFLLNEIFEQNLNENFLASQEKIFGKDCVYIIKEDKYKNWTETKAFEDGQDLLKHLIPKKNGKRS